ncbi:MAG: ABC transporter permease [Dehalococcoidia bacterium]
MARYALRRLLAAIPVLFAVSLVTFVLMHAIPGGPFDREKALPPPIIANLNRKFHLDDPLWKQYVDYVGGIVLHFDFGPSYTSRSRTVNDVIRTHLPVSAQLGFLALLVAIGMGIPLGVLAALKQNTWTDYSAMFVAVLGISIPNLALGPFLMWLFGLKLGLLPVATWGTPLHMVLPVVTLGTAYTAYVARLTRASMLQVIREDYIRTARAKGLSESLVMLRHALKNALIPVVTYFGPITAVVLTGTLVVEQIFAIPGLGRFFVTSISHRDYPVIMGTTLVFATVIIVANLLVDVSYALLNPRIRYR